FPDYRLAYQGFDSANVLVFREQVELFRRLLATAPPSPEQSGNIDYMLAAGELFTLIVYGQLILEKARQEQCPAELLAEIFAFLVRDFSSSALEMVLGHANTPAQEALFREMLKKPLLDAVAFATLWEKRVYSLRGVYEMNP
ncbi:MAG TPA: hypothetical protein VK857_08380, partial [Desulforhopalus sp.]|nr:hypothetical protein [Desulforhopalus sp.]